MFDRICSSNLTIVSQQRDEPDLTREQKHDVLEQLYSNNPEKFIYRFGSLLTDNELNEHFDSTADYIRKLTNSNRQKLSANRRYVYMQQLIDDGNYFSDEAMKERSPLLYEQLIGKYEDEKNKSLVKKTADGPLTDFYMQHLESLNHQQRVGEEFENERQSMDESDSDEEEEEEDVYSNEERDLYRQEFLSIHKGKQKNKNSTSKCVCFVEKFLNGEDTNIDYTSIDNNDSFDDVKTREHDEEEKYFDDEDSFTYKND